MVESTLWHPVALAGDVANTPLAVQLLDQAWVGCRPWPIGVRTGVRACRWAG